MDVISLPSDLPAETGSPAAAGALGGRLRRAREQAGVSLRGLARQIGVSPSLVSQIEHGRVTPSVATLYAMANALELSIDDLFRDPEPATTAADSRVGPPAVAALQGREGREVLRLASGIRWERLTRRPDPEIEFLYVVYEVGAASCPPEALMRHGGKEYAYLISGCLGVTVGDEQFEMRPGDSVSFDAQMPHRLWTIGDEPAVAVWTILNRHDDRRIPPAS